MEPRVVYRNAFSVMGLVVRFTSDDKQVGELWQRFVRDYEPKVRPFISEALFYGVTMPTDTEGMWDYMAGMAVGEVKASKIPKDLKVWTVPKGEFAMLETTLDTRDEAFDYIYRTWLPDSPYERDTNRPVLDVYSLRTTSGDSPVFIYIPLRSRL